MSKGQRGRPQRELDTSVPALAELAQQLRELRARAGLTLHELSAIVNWSPASLSTATTGRDLPRWELVQAWVLGCAPDANLALWRGRYDKAAVAAESAFEAGGGKGASPTVPAGKPESASCSAGQEDAIVSQQGPKAAAAADAAASPDRGSGTPADTVLLEQSAVVAWQSALEQAAWQSLTRQWHTRGLVAHPAPAPIRFTAVPADFMDQEEATRDLHGQYCDIAEIFALIPARRLLIAGDRSSGKTQLACHLGEQLLASGEDSMSTGLPVRFSLASWQPQLQSLQQWMACELNAMINTTRRAKRKTGPFHEELVTVLLGKSQLLPILDNFDKLSPRERGHALDVLNRWPATAQFVVVSGYSEFASAVEQTDTVITASAGIQLQPLNVDDLDGWLQRSSRSASRARSKAEDWAAVITVLRTQPDAPAARVLASPLLAGAARMLYTDGRADPRELISNGATVASLERRLTGYLVEHAAAGPDPLSLQDSPHRDPRRPTSESALHLALERIALYEAATGKGVRASADLYRPRPRGVLSTVLQSIFLALFAYYYLAPPAPEPDYYSTYPYETTPTVGGLAAFTGALLTGLLTCAYLRKESIWGTIPADRPGLAKLIQTFLTMTPGVICLGLNLTMLSARSYDGVTDGELFSLPFGLLIAVSSLLALSKTMTPDRAIADGILFFVTVLAAWFAQTDSVLLEVVGLRYVFLTTTTGQWLAAALKRPALLLNLSPVRLLITLTRATDLGLLEHNHESYTLSQAAIARYYRSAAPQSSLSPTSASHLWRRNGKHLTLSDPPQ
ncbi:helix-turn-helix domain-containing protein [Streptomyces longwoodensis]|uniref:helix-turn-helix domain-containing protein n=1 Tax=Streptomyces longwoodensis TaxID=68231 RepID=UPI0038262C9B